MMSRIIRCPKHGRVEGFFCKECIAERYVKDVKAGIIQPKVLLEHPDQCDSDLLPLQIRFRAYVERCNREKSEKAYSWRETSRVVRIVSSRFFEGGK
jgi:hypothetical protein